jgi:transcription elongation factor SPT6
LEKYKNISGISPERLLILKMKIIQILLSYKEDLNDIPYIITYQRNLYEPELEPIWKIFDYDNEWNKLFEMKINLKKSFEIVRNIAIDDPKKADIIYERYIENAKSINELQDIEVYIEFLKDLYFEEFNYINEENKILRPNKSSQIQNFRKFKIDEYSRKFSISAYELSMNLESLAIGEEENMIIPNRPDIQPEKLANDYLCSLYDVDIKVMTSGCKFLALELFSFPFIRNYARISFKSQCTISTIPTEEGKKELDAFHPSFRVKRIKNKPIDTFNNDLFLDILEAEKKNLINVEVQYGDNFFKDLTEKLNLTYNSKAKNNDINDIESIEHGWRVMREETLRIFVAEHCIPYFRKEVRFDLQEKAENYVIDECATNFSKLLLTGPYKKKKEPNEYIGDDYLFKEEEYPRVFSLIYDNDKNEVYSAMLDGNGEVIDCMKFSSLMIKPSKLLTRDEKEIRLEEDEKCKRIIQQRKPDLIVIGANDLKCKYLKDYIQSCDENMQSMKIKLINKIIFKI